MKGRTIRHAIRYRLHRCLSCRKRGVYTMTITAGNIEVEHRLCQQHLDQSLGGLLPIAESVVAHVDVPVVLRDAEDGPR